MQVSAELAMRSMYNYANNVSVAEVVPCGSHHIRPGYLLREAVHPPAVHTNIHADKVAQASLLAYNLLDGR